MGWFKKAAELRLGTALVVLIMFTLLLPGCQATSDESTPSQLTGSWDGTLNGQDVRAIFAPDNTFHLAFLDNTGELTGQAPALIETVEPVEVRDSVATVKNLVFHELTATTLSGDIGTWPLALAATPDARHSAQQADVAGQWSLDSAREIADVRIDAAGNLSGSDGVSCNYSGTMSLRSSAWNIYQLDLTVEQKPSSPVCLASGVHYSGYAMVIGADPNKTLWFSTAEEGGDNYLSGEWYATNNVAPVAVVSAPATVTVVAGETPVELDGSGSSDANHDPLDYTWTNVSGPVPVVPTNARSAIASFTASVDGSYTFRLTVSDGVVSSSENVTVNIVIVTDRFADNGNGTVTDNTTGLVWLKDANCEELFSPSLPIYPGLGLTAAKNKINELAKGKCSLADDYQVGDWRLPTSDELASLVDDSFGLSPTLSNMAGTAQWTPGDAFSRVGAGTFFGYWTDTAYSGAANYYIDFADGVSHTANIGTPFLVWPVRN